MIRAFIVALTAILLASCTPAKRDYVIWHPVSQAGVEREAWARGQPPPVRGLAIWGPDRPCEIWASPDDHEAIQHELRHCREGHFHEPKSVHPGSITMTEPTEAETARLPVHAIACAARRRAF